MKKAINPNVDETGDYILRWKLNPAKRHISAKDPFRALITALLIELFDILTLTYKGEDVKVDGFHFLNNIKVNPLYQRTRHR